CKMLGTTLDQVRIDDNFLIVTRSGAADIRIPVMRLRTDSNGDRVALLMDVPWFGGRDPLAMYDYRRNERYTQHISMMQVWDTTQTRKSLEHNLTAGDASVLFLLGASDPEKFKKLEHNLPLDPNAKLELIRS